MPELQEAMKLGGAENKMSTSTGFIKKFSLEGRIALITGAAGGLGWAMTKAIASAGAHVVLNDVHEQNLCGRIKELSELGLSGSAACFDVTDEQAVRREVAAIVVKHGRIDILVNNAGTQCRKPVTEYSLVEWEAVQRSHVTGSFLVTRDVAAHMIAQKSGRIIMITSVAIQSIKAELSAYAAAKGALAAMTRALAVELGPSGITCNALAPGFINTQFTLPLSGNEEFSAKLMERTPARRWGEPDDLAYAAVFLSSEAGTFVNGAVLTVDGGLLAAL